MVGNHVVDIVERCGDDPSSNIPVAFTDDVKTRQSYDYSDHGRAGNTLADVVLDDIKDCFYLLGPPDQHIARLEELRSIGVDQFAL
jgi:hypothetical protein